MAVTTSEKKLLVAGEWIETGDWVEVRSPYSGEPVARVAKAGAAETKRAIDAAEQAMLEPLPAHRRAEIHRAVRFEPFAYDEVVLVCPPRHRFAGRTIDVHELTSESLVVMQEGAGVRRIVEDELRRFGVRLRDLDPRLELGLQESVKSAVVAGHGVTFISSSAIEAELAAGTLAAARVEGLEPVREIALVRASGRSPTRAAEAFVAFAREELAA